MRRRLASILAVGFLTTSLMAAQPLNIPGSQTHAKREVRPEKGVVKQNSPRATVKNRSSKKASRPYQVGTASWYGKRFHGLETASGERFDMFQFTAAHRQLPLGTLVKVTDLENGRSVIVRINDRGPVPRDRIIDLSYGAARMLGLAPYGLQKVRLDLVNPRTVALNHNRELLGMPYY